MDQLTFGLSVSLVGMLVVFVGLFIIVCFINIMGMFGRRDKREKAKPAPAPVPAAESAIPSPAPIADDGVTPEILAAITAAIAAVMSGGEGGFRVRRVKRISNAPKWSLAGREDQIYSRM